jgi:hypothetical protein
MVYVSHPFLWIRPGVSPDDPDESKKVWYRCWSDRSWKEVADFVYLTRGRQVHWRQDGNSLPYYVMPIATRKDALRRGALIREWNNPQLPAGLTPTYFEKKKQRRETLRQENLAYQQKTSGGTFQVLVSEEDLLAATPPVRGPGPDPDLSPVQGGGDPDPSQEAAGTPPV